jgi:hypothetical protein
LTRLLTITDKGNINLGKYTLLKIQAFEVKTLEVSVKQDEK